MTVDMSYETNITTASGASVNDKAALKPRASLQNIGEKKDDDDKDGSNGGFQAFGADGFTFLDFLDIINPLQHIPVVSSLYREMTGDEIDPASRVAGSTLYGGPVGTVASLVNVALDESTGKDMGDHMLAWMGIKDGTGTTSAVELANAPKGTWQNPDAELATTEQTASELTTALAADTEVTDWARREAARFRGSAESAAVTPGAGVEMASAARALRATSDAGDVAGHIEVLNWARQEAAAARGLADKAAASQNHQEKAVQKAEITERQASAEWTASAGIRHDQLGGATAPSGGWFSETMLMALGKYDDGAALNKNSDPRNGLKTVDVQN